MPAGVAGIDVLNAFEIKPWMAGTSPAMTDDRHLSVSVETCPAMTDDRQMSVSVETCPAMTARVKFPRAAFSRGGRDFMGVAVYPSSYQRPRMLTREPLELADFLF
jgi:hypothetical protein